MWPRSRPAGPAPMIATAVFSGTDATSHLIGNSESRMPRSRAGRSASSTQWKHPSRAPAECRRHASRRHPYAERELRLVAAFDVSDDRHRGDDVAGAVPHRRGHRECAARELLDGARETDRADLGETGPQLVLG